MRNLPIRYKEPNVHYIIVDCNNINAERKDRAGAEALLAQLKIDNVDADWQIYAQLQEISTNDLEALYALAALLLEPSKVDPFKTALSIAQMDGTMKEVSLASIMANARANLDLIQIHDSALIGKES